MEIKIEKLFRRFNYDIKLKENDLTILTGPNGYGKSTILNCIEAISKGIKKIDYFFSIDFEKMVIENNKKKIEIIKNNDKEIIINNFRIKKEMVYEINYFLERNERRSIGLESDDSEIYSYFVRRKKGIEPYLDKLKEFSEIIGEMSYIKEQRLIQEIQENRTRRRMLIRDLEEEIRKINIIEVLPSKFKELIDTTLREYSNISNELDSTYPIRLFEDNSKMDENDYHKRIKNISKKFEKLKKYDLALNNIDIGNIRFDNKYSNALKIYFDDFDKKYGKYENLIEKLDLYTGIINERLTFKKIKISTSEGIKIVDENDKEIELSQLSSGEKHEIIIFYDLIFETNDNTLLLIDEPEISLHISWQKKFTEDLLKIIKYKKLNVIVATHSPEIIGEFWENQIDLGELYAINQY